MSNIKKFDQQVWIKDKLSIGDDYTQEPRVTIDMSGRTDAIFVPVGYNSNRPINIPNTSGLTNTVEGNGYFRYNKETEKFEGYEDLQWKNFLTTNANMEFIPNYYVRNLLELNVAYNDIRTSYVGGNIYIAGDIYFTSDWVVNLHGINFFGAGGRIYFINSDTTANNWSSNVGSGFTHAIVLTKGSPSFNNISFIGSHFHSSNDCADGYSREIIKFIGETSTTSLGMTFENCSFNNIVGAKSGSETMPVLSVRYNNTSSGGGCSVKLNKCIITSTDGNSIYGNGRDLGGFNIIIYGDEHSARNFALSVYNQRIWVDNEIFSYSSNKFNYIVDKLFCI